MTEVIISPQGSSFVFWTTKTLTDFRLMSVAYNGDQFVEGKVYASYDEFTSECAILITEMVPEGYPDLKVSFYDQNGQPQTDVYKRQGVFPDSYGGAIVSRLTIVLSVVKLLWPKQRMRRQAVQNAAVRI